ncbi:MAG: site-2 protease family protein [Candidatus ainarchaeum sp.]|nr:site-2 protease family protein [Candidatus ainarchaeum sp.]
MIKKSSKKIISKNNQKILTSKKLNLKKSNLKKSEKLNEEKTKEIENKLKENLQKTDYIFALIIGISFILTSIFLLKIDELKYLQSIFDFSSFASFTSPILFIIGVIILINLIWLKLGFGKHFGLKYIILMLKTKKFVNWIEHMTKKFGNIFEQMSIIGLFLGFGLTGVDYHIARKQSKIKRIFILLISSIIFALIFYYLIGFLFSVPLLAPLYLICFIAFIIMGLGGMTLAMVIGYGFLSIISLFNQTQICPSVAPVIPGVAIPGFGVIFPLITWISLGLILIIHELSHGVLLIKYKQKINSVGLLVAGFFPIGAFVEQDDKTFNNLEKRKIVNVLSAGPSSNLLTIPITLIFLILLSLLISPFTTSLNSEYEQMYSGVSILNVNQKVSFCGIDKNSPAFGKFQKGDILVSLNDSNQEIKNTNILNTIYSKTLDSNEPLKFIVLRDNNLVMISIMPVRFEMLGNKPFIGVDFENIKSDYVVPFQSTLIREFLKSILTILNALIILSFAVAMMNFVPASPLDGGMISQIIFLPYFSFLNMSEKDTMKFIGRLFTWLFWGAVVINLLPYLTMALY